MGYLFTCDQFWIHLCVINLCLQCQSVDQDPEVPEVSLHRLWAPQPLDDRSLGKPNFLPKMHWTNFATHTKPLRFQPCHFMTFFSEVLRIFDTTFAKIRHSAMESHDHLWPEVNPKSEIFSFCVQIKSAFSQFGHFMCNLGNFRFLTGFVVLKL